MVRLGAVANDHAIEKSDVNVAVQELDINDDNFGPSEIPDEDDLSTNVYGSRFASMDLPKYELPETGMPKEVAYRMIKDDVALDSAPQLSE